MTPANNWTLADALSASCTGIIQHAPLPSSTSPTLARPSNPKPSPTSASRWRNLFLSSVPVSISLPDIFELTCPEMLMTHSSGAGGGLDLGIFAQRQERYHCTTRPLNYKCS
eukprot:g39978.t1